MHPPVFCVFFPFLRPIPISDLRTARAVCSRRTLREAQAQTTANSSYKQSRGKTDRYYKKKKKPKPSQAESEGAKEELCYIYTVFNLTEMHKNTTEGLENAREVEP